MIKINATIENTYYNILKMYGSIDDIVDRALKLVEKGEIDMENCPQIPTSKNSKHVVITINNEYYEQQRALYGPTSPRVSINRLLYYIVDNEVYNDFGWTIADYDENTQAKISSVKYDILQKLKSLDKLCIKPVDKRKINEITLLINDL